MRLPDPIGSFEIQLPHQRSVSYRNIDPIILQHFESNAALRCSQRSSLNRCGLGNVTERVLCLSGQQLRDETNLL